MDIDPKTLLIALIAANAATFFLYWYDKHCAKRSRWRVSEGALLLGALAGGSPAAFVAMRMFRHKTKKGTFRLRYWCIVAMQAVAVAYYATHYPLL